MFLQCHDNIVIYKLVSQFPVFPELDQKKLAMTYLQSRSCYFETLQVRSTQSKTKLDI